LSFRLGCLFFCCHSVAQRRNLLLSLHVRFLCHPPKGTCCCLSAPVACFLLSFRSAAEESAVACAFLLSFPMGPAAAFLPRKHPTSANLPAKTHVKPQTHQNPRQSREFTLRISSTQSAKLELVTRKGPANPRGLLFVTEDEHNSFGMTNLRLTPLLRRFCKHPQPVNNWFKTTYTQAMGGVPPYEPTTNVPSTWRTTSPACHQEKPEPSPPQASEPSPEPASSLQASPEPAASVHLAAALSVQLHGAP
jgi:hypothetical protein